VPAITPGKGRAGNDNRAGVAQRLKPRPTSPVIATEGTTGTMPSPGLKPAVIVRTKSRRASVFGDAPDMTADEHRRRGEAADALWRELIRRTAGGEWPVGATGPQAAEGTSDRSPPAPAAQPIASVDPAPRSRVPHDNAG